MTIRNRMTNWIVVGVIELGCAGIGLAQDRVGETNPILVPATSPTTAPTPIAAPGFVKIPELLSPDTSTIGRSNDARVNDLILAHNARLNRIEKVRLVGKCKWFATGRPRAVRISFDFTLDAGELACADNSCALDADTLTLKPGSAMQVDGLYFLMFRRFDPAKFSKSAEDSIDRDGAKIPAVVMDSDKEVLWFDPTTGRPLRFLVKLEAGVVTLDYAYDPALPPGTAPVSVLVKLPPKWFGFDIGKEPSQIKLEMNPNALEVELRKDQ